MFQPAVEALDNWGALAETPHGKKTKQNFLDSFDSFIQYMDGKSCNQNVGLHHMGITPTNCAYFVFNYDQQSIL